MTDEASQDSRRQREKGALQVYEDLYLRAGTWDERERAAVVSSNAEDDSYQ